MSKEFINQSYYLISVLMIVFGCVFFFLKYERRKPQAREVVTLAVLCAIAVASRAAFTMVPFFKPMMGIIMITGMAFGAGAGFLTGTVVGFASNFLFGQGPWTPWQMLAYGVGGAVAGFLSQKGIMKTKKKIFMSVCGYVIIQFLVGPILDACSVFTMGGTLSKEWICSVFAAGIIPNAIHGAATFLTLFLLGKPMMEKLERLKLKYGMMREEEDEI